MLDGVGVIVGVGVGVRVGVMVGVRLGVRVGVIVGVVVAVGVLEGVSVKLDVGVTEGVRDGVGVGVSVGSIVGTTGVALPSDRGRYTTEWESAWADVANKHDAHTALNNRTRTEPSLPEVPYLTESGTLPPKSAPDMLRRARWYTGSHGRQVAQEEHRHYSVGDGTIRPDDRIQDRRREAPRHSEVSPGARTTHRARLGYRGRNHRWRCSQTSLGTYLDELAHLRRTARQRSR